MNGYRVVETFLGGKTEILFPEPKGPSGVALENPIIMVNGMILPRPGDQLDMVEVLKQVQRGVDVRLTRRDQDLETVLVQWGDLHLGVCVWGRVDGTYITVLEVQANNPEYGQIRLVL